MHGRSRMAVDPRILTMPGWSTSGFYQPEGVGWGGGLSFVARRSHVAIDHACLSRRRTVPNPNKRHLQRLGAQ